MTTMRDDIPRDEINDAVVAAGFDLEELTVTPVGGTRLVRVIIDSDHGVDLDQAAAVSRTIAEILDARGADLFDDQPYTLEVTSPGVGAPLTLPRHFRRAVGRLVTMVSTDGSTRQVRIGRVEGESIVGVSGGKKPEVVTVPIAEISRAKVEVEFSAPPAAVTELMDKIRAGETAPTKQPGSQP